MVPGEPLADYEVLWHDTEDADPVESEWCATCGRQVVFVVGWADLEPAGLDGMAGEGGS